MTTRTLLILSCINGLNYLDRYVVPALVPVLMAHFHLDQTRAGTAVSAFVFGYFLCSPLFGYLGDRLSRPKLMAIGVGLWSLATVLGGLSYTFSFLLMTRVMVGIGEASFGTIAPGYIRDCIGDDTRVNKAFSFFFAAIPVGSALGYVVAGWLVAFFPWEAVFFVAGVPGLLLAVWVARLKEHRHTVDEHPKFGEAVQALRGKSVLWLSIWGYVCNSFALSGIAAFVTLYGVKIGFKLEEISSIFGIILVLTGLAGTFGGSFLAERVARRAPNRSAGMLRFVGTGALVGVPFVAGAFLTSDPYLFLLLCFCAELAIFSGTAPINSVIVTSSPQRFVTLTQGITIFLMNLFGALLAPLVVGYVADQSSLSSALQLSALALLLCGSVWWVASVKAAKLGAD